MDYFDDLVDRLNKYSAEHQCHGGITAEAADAIKELSREYDSVSKSLCESVELVKRLNARERKRGKWVEPESAECYKCSACGRSCNQDVPSRLYEYCPHCGADMREGC